MILCIGTTPAAQRVMVFPRFTLDAVNRASRTLDGAAGKSVNVAKVLKALGAEPLAAGFLGGDRGEFISRTLQEKAIACAFVTVAERTRECVTIIDQTANRQTELVEESRPVSPGEFAALRRLLDEKLPHAEAVILSGTLAPGVPLDFYAGCVRQAHESGAFAVVDAQGPALVHALEAGPDVVKPNRAELAATVGHELHSEEDVFEAMRELRKRGARMVVVTHGRAATLASAENHRWRVTPPEVTAVNPIGSGDAFTAALTLRLAAKDDLGNACRWATAAGAANALTWMAGELDPADVDRLASLVRLDSLPSNS